MNEVTLEIINLRTNKSWKVSNPVFVPRKGEYIVLDSIPQEVTKVVHDFRENIIFIAVTY